ncbi:TetR/AcrR family transcriptional regulator [Mycobacterium simiae]|uniref:TetR/AcrR family transcriptional regulator n=1 Tax=Mycobacterium simiae TaxID=1784 RepID=UPI0020CB5AB7|nr:TetR/AcrR family transcriptional regulator [Mycobacterium simiae]
MPEPEEAVPQRRPGGRTARVKDAVHQAVLDVVTEHGVEKVGIPEISRRAGVRDSSIYRRWGSRENLILDALLAASELTLPVPDTGTLHGDLTAFATELIDYLAAPLGHGLLRALPLVTDSAEVAEARKTFWETRYQAAATMISRAAARGEVPPDTDARFAIELLIAPIHFRNLLTWEPIDAALADQLATYVVRALRPDGNPATRRGRRAAVNHPVAQRRSTRG